MIGPKGNYAFGGDTSVFNEGLNLDQTFDFLLIVS